VVKNCQFNFSSLPIRSQITTRTTRFLHKFTCLVHNFDVVAKRQASNLITQYFRETEHRVLEDRIGPYAYHRQWHH